MKQAEILIKTPSDLADLRACRGAVALLPLLRDGHDLHSNDEPGIGKTTTQIELGPLALEEGVADWVAFIAPRNDVADRVYEAWSSIPGRRVLRLRSRPKLLCGSLDTDWRDYEKRGQSALARQRLCSYCPQLESCSWLEQWSAECLSESDGVVMTAASARQRPHAIQHIADTNKSEKPLVLCDEDDFAMSSVRREIAIADIRRTIEVVERMMRAGDRARKTNIRVHQALSDLIVADSEALRSDSLNIPAGGSAWAFRLQELGETMFPEEFQYVLGILAMSIWSPPTSRQRSADAISFSLPITAGRARLAIFSATASTPLLSFRVNRQFLCPHASSYIRYEGTRWFNITDGVGSANNFQRNHRRVIRFFAALIARRLQAGLRVVVVVRKKFLQLCRRSLQQRLAQVLPEGYAVNVGFLDQLRSGERLDVVLINYGTEGVNDLEEYDCCFCMMSYFVDVRAITGVLQDLLADDFHVPMEITFSRSGPRRRSIRAVDNADLIYDPLPLAQEALRQEECGVVKQAVGRVRPWTNAREIITFQASQLPGVKYDREFASLAEARRYFDIPDGREENGGCSRAAIQAARAAGCTQRQAVEQTGRSLSTVKRYWNND